MTGIINNLCFYLRGPFVSDISFVHRISRWILEINHVVLPPKVLSSNFIHCIVCYIGYYLAPNVTRNCQGVLHGKGNKTLCRCDHVTSAAQTCPPARGINITLSQKGQRHRDFVRSPNSIPVGQRGFTSPAIFESAISKSAHVVRNHVDIERCQAKKQRTFRGRGWCTSLLGLKLVPSGVNRLPPFLPTHPRQLQRFEMAWDGGTSPAADLALVGRSNQSSSILPRGRFGLLLLCLDPCRGGFSRA